MAEPRPHPRDAAAAYARLPYPTRARRGAHPDALAVMARLFGLAPAPVAGCRVLSIGCGDGGNLLPIAARLPDARFVGVDLSERAIATARARAEALGLGHVELRAGDLATLDPERLGVFDHVIAAGVYSWVPAEARDHLLALCGRCLAPGGVAYVSHNVPHGWADALALRDGLLARIPRDTPPAEMAAQARGLVPEVVAERPALRHEATLIDRLDDAQLFFDYLAEPIVPVALSGLLEHGARHGLQYLGDARRAILHPAHLPPRLFAAMATSTSFADAQETLDQVARRRFRTTLLCRTDASPDLDVTPERLAGLLVRARFREVPGPAGRRTLEEPEGVQVTVRGEPALALVAALEGARPGAIAVDDVLAAAGAAHPGCDPRDLAGHLTHLYFGELVDLHAVDGAPATRVAERPRARAITRHEADRGAFVTTAWHESVQLGPLTRRVLARCDGSRTVAQLADELAHPEADVQDSLDSLLAHALLTVCSSGE